MTLLLWINGAVVSLFGASIVAWAIRGHRTKTPRCRRCRYSMEGVASLTCSECGWTAKREQLLTAPIRRRKTAVLGLVIVLVGAGVVADRIVMRSYGSRWPVTPTIGLVVAFEFIDTPELRDEIELRRIESLPGVLRRRLLHTTILRDAAKPPGMTVQQYLDMLGVGRPPKPAYASSVADRLARRSPQMAQGVALRLLQSDDARHHKAALENILQVGLLSDRFSDNGRAWGRLNMTIVGGAPPVYFWNRGDPAIDRSTYTDALRALSVARLKKDASLAPLSHRLAFLADLEPFDPRPFEGVVSDEVAGGGYKCYVLAMSLMTRRGPEGAAVIAKWLEDPDALVRELAAHALGLMRVDAAAALDQLRAHFGDEDPAVAEYAVWAWDEIDMAMERRSEGSER